MYSQPKKQSLLPGPCTREELIEPFKQKRQTDPALPRVLPKRFALSRLPRAVIVPLGALFCLLMVVVQALIAAVIWFLGVVEPLQPWSSLFLDGLVVLVWLGGPLVLLQPLLRLRPSWDRWVIVGTRLPGTLLLLLAVGESVTIVGELLALGLPGYWWQDLLPLLWVFLFFVLVQILLAWAGVSLLHVRMQEKRVLSPNIIEGIEGE